MEKITTQQCKRFLVDFFKETPDLIKKIYENEEGIEIFSDALIEKNWKRVSKCKPGSENSYVEKEGYSFFEKSIGYPRGPDYYIPSYIKREDVSVERVFTLLEDKYENSIMFIVVETKLGELFLGQFVGD